MTKNISGYELETIKQQIKEDQAVGRAAEKYLALKNEHTAVIAQNRVLRDVATALYQHGGDEAINQRVQLQEQRAIQINEKIRSSQEEIQDAIKSHLEQTGVLEGVTNVDKVVFQIPRFVSDVKKEIISSMDKKHKSAERELVRDALSGVLGSVLETLEREQVGNALLSGSVAQGQIVKFAPVAARAVNQ